MTDYRKDIPETRYEITFWGTIGKQRKERRHTFHVPTAFNEKTGEPEGEPTREYALELLKLNGAKRGKWALTSYTAYVSDYPGHMGEGIVTSAMRPLFDNSTKNLAVGELGK